MPASNTCWGIEVGAYAVKALKLQLDGETPKAIDFAVIPHKRVLSTPEVDAAEATRIGVGALVNQVDLSNSSLAISVPGHSAFARFAKLPPVEPKKIPDIVKFEAVQQIPFPIQDVEWDYQTFQSPDSPDVEVGIFAMTRERINERLALWADLGMTPDIVTLGPVAAFNAVAFDLQFSEKTPGTVILDVGTTSTDLIVADAGRVWIRTFPLGGHQFTEALVNAFKLSYPKAEKLKREAEQSKHARHIFQAMRPVFDDLGQDVQRSIGYYQGLHRDAALTRLIGLGSTFKLPGLRKFLGQQLQLEVIRLDQFNRVTLDGPRSGEFQAASLNLATCYGLALQGLGMQTIDANLIPTVVVRESTWRKKTKWFALAAGLGIAAGGVSFFRPVFDGPKVDASRRPAVIQQVKSDVKRLKNEWKEVESAWTDNFLAANVASLSQNRDIYARLINDVGVMLQHAEDLRSASPDRWGTAPTPWAWRFQSLATHWGPSGDESASSLSSGDPFAAGTTPFNTEDDRNKKRILIRMNVTTAVEDAEAFITDSLQQWLFDHASRADAPYTVVKGSVTWTKVAEEVIPFEVAIADQPEDAGREAGPRGARTPPRRRDPSSLPTIGGPPPGAGEMVGEGAVSASAAAAAAGGQSHSELNNMAPLPPIPPLAPPGSTLVTFELRWKFELVEPAANEETQ